jgi:hypothetical protein
LHSIHFLYIPFHTIHLYYLLFLSLPFYSLPFQPLSLADSQSAPCPAPPAQAGAAERAEEASAFSFPAPGRQMALAARKSPIRKKGGRASA